MAIPTPQTRKGPKDVKQYLAELDALLKRNTGSGTYIGADVSSNTPMYIPGRVANPSGLGDVAPSISRYGSGMTEPTPVERQAPLEYQEPTTQEQPYTASSFMEDIARAIYAPRIPSQQSTEELEQIYQATGQKYAVQSLANGQVRYNDGSVGYPQQETPAQPVASLSDGNVLWSDGWARPPMPEYLMNRTGIDALSQGLFGTNQTVTQAYGNINPIEPTPGNVNLGTDFRTRDLQQHEIRNYFDQPLRVVDIYTEAQPGSGYVGNYENQGYGNSILLQMADGSMIRISHFDQLPNYQVGQLIQPGQIIGIPGMTGNTTGEHADVEYYSPDGVISSPDQLIAQVANASTADQRLYQPYGENQSTAQPEQPQVQSQAQSRVQPQQVTQPKRTGSVLGIQNIFDSSNPQPAFPNQPATSTLEQTVPVPTPTLPAQTQPVATPTQEKAPFTPTPIPTPAGEQGAAEQRNSGDLVGSVRQLAGNLVDTASTPLKRAGLPDLGISEAIAGGKTVNTDVNLAPQAGASNGLMSVERKAPDYANVLKGNVTDALSQAGEGIKSLGQAGVSALNNIFQPKQPQLQRAVGDVAGKPGDVAGTATALQTPNAFSSLMDTASSMQSLGKNDIRDPFFKSGMSSNYQDYLRPNAQDLAGGALTLDLFNPEFYQSKANIDNIFGGTNMSSEANKRYSDFVEAERAKAEAKRLADIEDRKQKPGELWTEWMKRTGGQSTLDAIRSNPRLSLDERSGAVAEVGSGSHPSDVKNPYNDFGRQMSVGPQQGVTNAIRAAGAGYNYISPSGGLIHNYSPANANMSDASTGLPVRGWESTSYSKPKAAPINNIFNRSKEFLNNIFRR